MKNALLVLFALCAASRGNAQALDATFGTAGVVTTAVSTAEDYANSMAIQPDGKILAGGFAKVSGASQFALCRYNANGSLDNTFSTDGMVTTAIGTTADGGRGLALQPDGKIIQSGYTYGANLDFAVIRYNADGTPDNTFNSTGIVTTAVGTGNDVGGCIALQADGKIIVAGRSEIGTTANFALVRYNANGTLDAGFGTGGKVVTVFPVGHSEINAITLQSDGKIVAVGKCGNSTDDSMAVARYNTDGTSPSAVMGW